MSRLFPLEHEQNSDDWYTPPWVFEGLGVTFDLDVAAPPGGLPWIPARRHYTIVDDGLDQPWEGLVWCNPPYGNPSPWCRRWAQHPEGLPLIRADLSSECQHVAFAAADAIWVPRPRLAFVPGHEANAHNADFSTVLLSRGESATLALHRLAASGGTTRSLIAP